MARTYRRCTNKTGKRIPQINLEKEKATFPYLNDHDRYYELYYFTSDRSFEFDSRFLKHFEHRNRRAAERMAINKILADIEIADQIVFNKINENPWNWD